MVVYTWWCWHIYKGDEVGVDVDQIGDETEVRKVPQSGPDSGHANDRTLSLSVRSLRDQSLVHSVGPFSSPFLHRVDPHQLQLHLLCKCANTTKCTPSCVCVLAFSQSFSKGLATQLATPINPNDDAKLDHSSGTR